MRGKGNKIAALGALMAAAVLVTALMFGCGSAADRCKVAPEADYFSAAAEITALGGFTVTGTYGDAAIAAKRETDGTKYALYNFRLDKFVVSPAAQSISRRDKLFGVTSENGEITYYSQAEKIVTLKADEAVAISSIGCDYTAVITADKSYFIDEYGAVKTAKNGIKSLASSLDYATDKYLLDVEIGSGSSYINVFARDTFELVRKIELGAYVYGGSPEMIFKNILGDGNVAFQYATAVPEDSNDYEMEISGHKVKLRTFVVDVASGKVTAKKTDFLLGTMVNKNSYGAATAYEKCYAADNIALVMNIKDKSLASTPAAVALNNDLSVDYDFAALYGVGYLPIRIADDRYFLQSVYSSGNRVLVNGKGELLADGFAFDPDLRVIVKGDRAYDLDLNLIASGKISGTYGKYVLYAKDDDVYYINDKKIDNLSSDAMFGGYGIYETVSGGKYTLRAASGTELRTSYAPFAAVLRGDGYGVVTSAVDGIGAYYKLTPAA